MNPNPDPDPDPDKMPTGVRPQAPPEKQAWKATNEDMEAIAEERREEGWDVVSMPSLHVNPMNREDEADELSGLAFIIPNNHADDFEAAYGNGDFPEYLVYRREVKKSAFLVLELIDPDSDTIVLVAGRYDLQHARNAIPAIIEQEEIAVAIQTIDGTQIASFRYDDYGAFIPTPDESEAEAEDAETDDE
jgi:hypothetical protein